MKLALVTFAGVALALLSGCGKPPPTPTTAPSAATTSSPAPAAVEPAANTNAPPPVVAEPSAAEQAGAAKPQKPAHQVSEMDDDTETVDSSSSTATPALADADSTAAPEVAHFKEVVNYKAIIPAQPTTVPPGHVAVAEMFWYGCPHCYALDPELESWRQGGKPGTKPTWVDFVRIPATWNDALRLHARLFYTLDALGRLDELHPAVFTEVQVNGNPLDTADKIGSFLRAHGVDGDEFQRAFSSTAVLGRVAQADLLGRRYRAQSVPMIVINGKYWTDVALAGSPDKLVALINELTLQEHTR